MVFKTTFHNLNQLKEILHQMEDDDLSEKLTILNSSSIGMHIRHVLEFYICLIEAQQTKVVNYDLRKRDLSLETSTEKCTAVIYDILENIEGIQADKDLTLIVDYSVECPEEAIQLKTSLYRELLYNIEHCTHHMAIIKIGLKTLQREILINDSFGVASSTIRNNTKCAQ